MPESFSPKSTFLSLLKSLLADYVHKTRYGSVRIKRKWGAGSLSGIIHRATPEEDFLTSLDLKGKTVYDIGGFIGLLSVVFAKAVGQTGKVIVFEPNEENHAQLLETLRVNRVDNVRVLKLGISDTKGKEQPFIVHENFGATGSLDQEIQSQIVKTGRFKHLHIDVDTLDNAVATYGLPKPDFIKIDIEGMEYQALLGMTEILRTGSPQFHIEIHGADQLSKRENIGRIVAFLESQGYLIWHVETRQDIHSDNSVIAREGHIFCKRPKSLLAHNICSVRQTCTRSL